MKCRSGWCPVTISGHEIPDVCALRTCCRCFVRSRVEGFLGADFVGCGRCGVPAVASASQLGPGAEPSRELAGRTDAESRPGARNRNAGGVAAGADLCARARGFRRRGYRIGNRADGICMREAPERGAGERFRYRRRMVAGGFAGWRYSVRLTTLPARMRDSAAMRLPQRSGLPLYVLLRPFRLLRQYRAGGGGSGARRAKASRDRVAAA